MSDRMHASRLFLHRVSMLVAPLVLAGCAGLVTPPTAFTLFDLGTAGAQLATDAAIVPGGVEVRAPSWLASSAMQYRLDYRSPASREAFGESRWAGHPAEMLQRLMGASFGEGASTAGPCRLRVELDEFIQSFDSLEQSATELRARVSLVAPRDELTVATRGFVVRTLAQSADAPGGVVAHREGARRFIIEVADWFETLDQAQSGRLNDVDRCRR